MARKHEVVFSKRTVPRGIVGAKPSGTIGTSQRSKVRDRAVGRQDSLELCETRKNFRKIRDFPWSGLQVRRSEQFPPDATSSLGVGNVNHMPSLL